MEEKKNNNGILIGIIIGIVIMLLLIGGFILFTTNAFSFYNNQQKKIENQAEEIKDKAEEIINKSKEQIEENKSQTNDFSLIIEEYKTAMNDNDYIEMLEPEKEYPNINTTTMRNYHRSKNSDEFKFTFYYTYYDINKDNKNELIISTEPNGNIVEMYTHNNIEPIRFYNSICLGERCFTDLYDNGIIKFYGSGGAAIHYIEFYKIAADGYSKEIINGYEIKYDENMKVTITDKDKNITNYKSDEEIIKSMVKDSKKIDLSNSKWIEIK